VIENKKIEEDLSKWKNISCSWMNLENIVPSERSQSQMMAGLRIPFI
jgi:hypothetical protein